MSKNEEGGFLGGEGPPKRWRASTRMEGVLPLQQIAADTLMELNTEYLLRLVMNETTKVLGADRSTLFLVDRARGELWSKIAEGLEINEIRIPMGAGIAGHVAATGQVVNISDVYSDPRFTPEVDRKTGYRSRSVLSMPLRDPRGNIVAVIEVLNKRNGSFTSQDELALAELCSQAAILVAALADQSSGAA